MERLTDHHLFFERKAWSRESRFHKRLTNHRSFLIPMPRELHNFGKDSLHANVAGVPVILPDQAERLVTQVSDCKPGEWLRNVDTAIAALYNISESEPDMTNGDLAHWAAENLVAQRSYIAKAVGGSVIYVMGA